jgi:alkylation response protein AidB-like acyl-CoA dehydrogenase
MNFEMSDDRRMLADTLQAGAMADGYGFEHRTGRLPRRFTTPGWTALTELGLLYAFADEDAGGMGGSGFDIAVVFEELGRALCPEPVLPALMAIRAGRTEEVLSGATRYAVAFGETDAPYDLDDLATEARETERGWQVFGRKTVVYGAGVADRSSRWPSRTDGLGLFDIAATEAEITAYGMIDGGPAGEVTLDAAHATRLDVDATASAGHARLGRAGAVGRGAGRDGNDLRHANRLPRHAHAVRQTHRQLPGVAAPRRGPVDRDRAGTVHHHRRRRRHGYAGPGQKGEPGQAFDRPHRPDWSRKRRSRCMAASR